jgi:hypothetical protein
MSHALERARQVIVTRQKDTASRPTTTHAEHIASTYMASDHYQPEVYIGSLNF